MTAPNVLRTPAERFTDLTDFPHPPRYVDDLRGYEGLRASYLDLGPADADRTVLCLHGEPTWGYLYRTMIPVLAGGGARVVVPDLFGFGRSDKPVEESTYTFSFHRDHLLRLAERLELRRVTLVVQDWGGTLGLTLPVDARFRSTLDRLVIMNTSLPIGEPLGPHYYQWREQVRSTPDPPIGQWVRDSTPQLTDAQRAAYDAPFPDRRYKTGPRTFPNLAMVEPQMDGVREAQAALQFWSEQWSGPTFMAIGADDPDVDAIRGLRTQIRGCPEPLEIADAGHFVPEVAGESVARAALRSFGDG